MSDDQKPRNRKRSGWWIAIIVVTLPLLYVLSPPIMIMLVGYPKSLFIVYSPLIVATENFYPVEEFYEWYFIRVSGNTLPYLIWRASAG
jgi:hypothetical protein